MPKFHQKSDRYMRIALIAAIAIAVGGCAAPARAETAQYLQLYSASRLLAQINMLNEKFCAEFLGRMQERFSAGMAGKCGTQPVEEAFVFHAVLRMANSPSDSDAYFPSQESCEGFTLAISRGTFATLIERCRPR
jgi:hypothetical protein